MLSSQATTKRNVRTPKSSCDFDINFEKSDFPRFSKEIRKNVVRKGKRKTHKYDRRGQSTVSNSFDKSGNKSGSGNGGAVLFIGYLEMENWSHSFSTGSFMSFHGSPHFRGGIKRTNVYAYVFFSFFEKHTHAHILRLYYLYKRRTNNKTLVRFALPYTVQQMGKNIQIYIFLEKEFVLALPISTFFFARPMGSFRSKIRSKGLIYDHWRQSNNACA